jgi:hypothetical protein
MSETAHAEDGIDIQGNRFDFETCERIGSFTTLQQLTDDDIAPLCTILGRFKRVKLIMLVSRGVCARGSRCSGVEREREREWRCG